MNKYAHLEAIKVNTPFIPATVHYHKRRGDKVYEIVATLPAWKVAELGLSIGGEVVLATASDRQEALNLVRYFRGHINDKS